MPFDPSQPIDAVPASGGFDPDALIDVVPESQTIRRIKADKRFTPEQTAIRVKAAQEGAAEFDPNKPVSLATRVAENAKEAFGQTLAGTMIKSVQIPFPGDTTPGQELPDGAPVAVRRAKGQLNNLLQEKARRAGTAVNLAGQPALADPTYSELPDSILDSQIAKAQTRYNTMLGPNQENLQKWSLNRARQIAEVVDKPAAAYEAMPDAQGIVQRGAAVVGGLAGGLPTPENLVPIEGAPAGASLLRRVLTTGGQVAAQTAVAEPIRQAMAINSGQQSHFEPDTAVERVGTGFAIGGALEVGSAVLSKILSKFAKVKPETIQGKTPEEAAAAISKETGEDVASVKAKIDEAANEVSPSESAARSAEKPAISAEEVAKTVDTEKAPAVAEPVKPAAVKIDPEAAVETPKPESPVVGAEEAPTTVKPQKYSKSTDDLAAGETFKVNGEDYAVTAKHDDGSVSVMTPDRSEIVLPPKTDLQIDLPSSRRVAVDDDEAIEAAAAAQQKPAAEAPVQAASKPQYQYTIQRPIDLGDGTKAPGYMQIDEIVNGVNTRSSSLEALRKEGIDLPDIPEHLPTGQYTEAEIRANTPGEDGKIELKINTRDGEQTLRVTPEQKAAYDAERADLKQKQDQIRNNIATRTNDISATGQEAAQGDLRRVALQSAARVRQILGTLTPKEQAAAAREANVLRPGRSVEVTLGKNNTIRGTVERQPAFGKVAIKTEDGRIIRTDARNAKVIQPERVSAATALRDVASVTSDLAKYGYKNPEAIVKAMQTGDAKSIVDLVRAEGRSQVGDLQSAYLTLKKLGKITEPVDIALRTGLLDADRDLFRVFDGAETFKGVGISALPPIELRDRQAGFIAVPEMKAAREAATAALGAAKEVFNTTGGVSPVVFDLVDRMHNANVAAVSRIRILSDRIARAMNRNPDKLTSAAAYAFLNPSYLRQTDPAAAGSLRAAAAKFSPELRAALTEARTAMDTMTRKLLALGVPKEEFAEIMQNNLGRYISRSYQIFGYNKEEYIRKLTTMGTEEYRLRYLPAVEKLGKETVDKIIAGIERTNEWDRAKVDQYIDDSVRRLGSTAALNRTIRDQTLRDLFGEIIDPVQATAHTLVKQQELAGTFNFRKQLSDYLVKTNQAKTIDSNQILKDYLNAESSVIKERVDAFVEQQRKRAETAGRPFDEAKVREFAESQNPNFDARVDQRVNELRIESEAMGEEFNHEAALREAERDVYKSTEENAYKWYRDSSGQVGPDETLLRLEDFYKNDVAMAQRINDPFANLVVKNDSIPFLMEYKKLEPEALSLMQEISSMANSSATVLSPLTTARNILTSWQTMLTSGNALRTLATEDGRDAVKVAAAIAVHRIFGTALPKDLERTYMHVLNNGVLHKGATSGITQNLVDAGLGFFKRLPKALRDKSISPLTETGQRMRPEESIARIVWGKESRVAGVPLEKLTRKAQDIYQLGDDFPKIINYLNEVSKAKEAFGNTPEAMAEAKRKFDMTNFDYSRAISVVRLARKVPFFGAFTSFISEAYRTSFNAINLAITDTWKGAATGNKALLQQGMARLVGVTAALGTAATLAKLSRDSLGLSHEDERNLRQYLPEWTRNSHIYWYKASDGTVQYIDLGHPELYESVTRPAAALIQRIISGQAKDDPNDTLWNETKNQLWEIVKPFVGLQIAPQAAVEALSGRTQNGVPIWAADDGVGDKWVKSLTHLLVSIGTPGGLKSGKTVVQGLLGETNKLGQPIDPVKPLYNLFGVGEIEMNNGFKFFSRRQSLELRGIESEWRRLTEDMSSSVSEDDIYNKLAEVNERRRVAWNELVRGIQVAQVVGVDRREIMSQMKDQGYGRAEIAAAVQGLYEPYIPSKETFIRARKAGRTLDVQRIRDIVLQARDIQ